VVRGHLPSLFNPSGPCTSLQLVRPLPLVLSALLAVLPACHRTPRPRAKVVTSIFPVYDLTRRIAGEDADVVMLEPVGSSPHTYTATPGDVERSTGANLAVMIGLDLDAWLEPLMTRVGAPKGRILRLADRVPTLPRRVSLTEEAGQAKRDATRRAGEPDPRGVEGIDVHVWLDPQRALLMERAITDELCRVDPDHAKGFRTRGLAVTTSLEALDTELEQRTRGWKHRSFATLHDAFRYYASRYHFDVVAAVDMQPGARTPIRYEQMVLSRMRERGATAIFGEPQLDSRPSQTLSHAGPFAYGVLDPIGGTAGVDSYEALLRHDTDVLEKTLETQPPAAPRADAAVNDAAH